MLIQYVYALLTMIPCPMWFWYRWASAAFLIAVFVWSIYNGATYYIDVFGKRFQNDEVADQAFLKTGTLEGVRAIAGYVFGPTGKRFVVVCFVNHPNASRAQRAIDVLVQWVYDNGH